MAITASISLSPSTIASGAKSVATLTVSKSDAGAITITRCDLHVSPAPAFFFSRGGQSDAVALPGSDSATIIYDVVAVKNQTDSGTYTIDGVVYTSDGSVTAITGQNLTISAPADWHPDAV